MAGRCKRTWQVRSATIPAAGTLDLSLSTATIEYLIRVVDVATFAGVAFTLANGSDASTVLHLQAGESYQEERIGPVASAPVLRVAAAAGAKVELVVWDA